MHSSLAVFALGALTLGAACATTTPADREATGIQQMAVGGGFVATGTLALAGSAAGGIAVVVAAGVQPEYLVGAGIGAALGGAQLIGGLLLLRQGRCVYLGRPECTPTTEPTAEDAAAAEAKGKEAERLRGQLLDACLSQKCKADEACWEVGAANAEEAESLTDWLEANGCT